MSAEGALRSLVAHWHEFGPEHGFDEAVDAAARALLPEAEPPGRDAAFERWLVEGLVWLPERGMGWYPVAEAPYNAAYFAKYQRYAATPMGRSITAARIDLVERHAGSSLVCDVGIGCGDFVDDHPRAYGFDINPAGVDWLLKRGRFFNPWKHQVDALTFWDCLEHIPNPGPLLANAREWVFVSLPIVPGDGPPPLDWRHLRRDEHCLYWTADGFVLWMAEHGFGCVEVNDEETRLGRQDILSFAFRRTA